MKRRTLEQHEALIDELRRQIAQQNDRIDDLTRAVAACRLVLRAITKRAIETR